MPQTIFIHREMQRTHKTTISGMQSIQYMQREGVELMTILEGYV